MKTRYDAGLKVKYNLPYPDFLRLSIPAANEIAEPVIVTEMQPLARAEPQFALPVADKTAEQVMTKETLTIAIDETQEDPQAASKRLEQPLLEQSAINQLVRKKQAAQDALPKVKTSIFSRVHDWLQNKLFNHQIKTINGKEWAGTIEKIDGVAIRRDSGSSHFEVLLEGKVVGGFFHSNEYSVGYKKRLQQIIINLGYSPSPHRSPQKTVPNSRAASS
jgi:ribonucleotide reductase alpha subunit